MGHDLRSFSKMISTIQLFTAIQYYRLVGEARDYSHNTSTEGGRYFDLLRYCFIHIEGYATEDHGRERKSQ